MSAAPRVVVLVPAWNEEQVISGVLTEIMTVLEGTADVVVISDGSTDATAAIARGAGATVLDLPVNLGVGGAMRAGYLYALRHGYDYAVQVDADGQHDPSEIASLLAAAQDQGADLVIGARFAGKGDYEVHGPRHWAMSLLSVVLSRVCRTRLTDTTSGFKLTSRRAIGLFSREYPAEYLGDTIEALVIAARSGLRITQVPVEMRPRAGGTPSHNPLKAARFLMRAFMALSIALTRPRAALVPPSKETA
ncbi:MULTISPECIES: glycosyltransferase family 2 protein [unclassified Actinomyces]|uniref:glycosyltransferase family 2 protein n=1 Tax=unclassified Actinomyces TaxID=2609248 RepID=UPI0020182BCD|nr:MULTISPECIES: glycosyltransferase family 2 protein [unclassified Actinomyces]MCL3777002.1 glycosyltransferase family 2 protein [Actinomyces sp. AC-20-1]MCL3789057.1 glycosyltransferase family 2 protein [Actinomyces sp. 187325]MCL3791429.1 glycosyltransferase family 2 protein [Actinomyces sp. 186855]MCL3794041.1 glycosyltransferase family 2 protein [Actinomyces sp. 217892]